MLIVSLERHKEKSEAAILPHLLRRVGLPVIWIRRTDSPTWMYFAIYTNTYQESVLPTYSDITFVKCPILRSRNKRKCAFYQYVRTLTLSVRSKGRHFLRKDAQFSKIIFRFARNRAKAHPRGANINSIPQAYKAPTTLIK